LTGAGATGTTALPEIANLGAHLEAMLLATAKPVPIDRLARAVGLAPAMPDEDDEPVRISKGAKASARPTETEGAPGEAPADAVAVESKPTRSKRAMTAEAQREAQTKAACRRIEREIDALNASYEREGRSFRIERVSGGCRVMTLSAFAPSVAALARERQQQKLTRAAIETLAIIAYKQPITRAQLEAIRGVACGEVLRSLMERRVITIKGRAEELGRPILYGTSRQFLEYFGLASIADLPQVAELRPGV